MDYKALLDSVSPGFFQREDIRRLSPERMLSEMVLDLGTFDRNDAVCCPEGIRFGFFSGELQALRAAVAEVDEEWLPYFGPGCRCFCAFDADKPVSFCLLDEMCRFQGLRVSGPGCVGTVPPYRGHRIGLEMVRRATLFLKEAGYALSYIHYTHIDHWYARLGYRTVLRWNRDGIVWCAQD